jgi:hypothetical protein
MGKRVWYGPETSVAVPYDISRKGNAIRYGRRRFGAVPYPYGLVSVDFMLYNALFFKNYIFLMLYFFNNALFFYNALFFL